MIRFLSKACYRLEDLARSLRSRPDLSSLGDPHETDLIFLVAAPRSGTTWLQKALNEHPEMTCGENRLFGSYFDVVQTGCEKRLRVTLDYFTQTLAARASRQKPDCSASQFADQLTAEFAGAIFRTWRRRTGKRVLVDKVTPYPGTSAEVIRNIRRFFPQAKFIRLIRDGRDVVTSGVFHWLSKHIEVADRPEDPRLHCTPRAADSRFFRDEDIRHWAETWRDPILATESLRPDEVLEVRYEQMIEDFSTVLNRICEFVSVSAQSDVLKTCVRLSSFKRMSGGRAQGDADPGAHVRRGIVGDWKNYFTAQDGQLFDSVAGELLQSLGYVSDRRWPDELPTDLRSRDVA